MTFPSGLTTTAPTGGLGDGSAFLASSKARRSVSVSKSGSVGVVIATPPPMPEAGSLLRVARQNVTPGRSFARPPRGFVKTSTSYPTPPPRRSRARPGLDQLAELGEELVDVPERSVDTRKSHVRDLV